MNNCRAMSFVLLIATGLLFPLHDLNVFGKDNASDSKKDNGDKDKENNKQNQKEKDDVHPWQKVKSFSGAAKVKPKELKFLVTTPEWRLTLSTEPDGDGKESKIRATLLVETARDQDNEPVNWKQLDVLYDGNATAGGTKVFQDGVSNQGEPKWFMVVVSGHLTQYKLSVEDRGKKRSSK
jgi:hypothetical protein